MVRLTKCTRIVACILSLMPSISQAQTAEETVLFMTLAYEPDSLLWKDSSIRASRNSHCKYAVVIARGDQLIEVNFDFSNMNDYEVDPSITITGKQIFNVKFRNEKTQKFDVIDGDKWELIWLIPPRITKEITDSMKKRLVRAAAYFRTNFCKGRAW